MCMCVGNKQKVHVMTNVMNPKMRVELVPAPHHSDSDPSTSATTAGICVSCALCVEFDWEQQQLLLMKN